MMICTGSLFSYIKLSIQEHYTINNNNNNRLSFISDETQKKEKKSGQTRLEVQAHEMLKPTLYAVLYKLLCIFRIIPFTFL